VGVNCGFAGDGRKEFTKGKKKETGRYGPGGGWNSSRSEEENFMPASLGEGKKEGRSSECNPLSDRKGGGKDRRAFLGTGRGKQLDPPYSRVKK